MQIIFVITSHKKFITFQKIFNLELLSKEPFNFVSKINKKSSYLYGYDMESFKKYFVRKPNSI